MLLVTFSFGVQGQTPLTITSAKTWSTLPTGDQTDAQKYGIIINNNGILTIDAPVTFHYTASIRVNGGGILIVRNKLTCDEAANFGHNFPKEASPWWKGVIVGPSTPLTSSHFGTLPDPLQTDNEIYYKGVINYAFGIVKLELGAIIENATIGIDAVNGGIVESFAGMETGNGPKILNCHKGIILNDYTPLSGDNGFTAYRLNSILFSNNNDNSYYNSADNAGYEREKRIHLEINNVQGVFIGGCVFECVNKKLCSAKRGKGIESTNSKFTVGEAGNVFINNQILGCTQVKVKDHLTETYKSEFINLSTAVVASNNSNTREIEINNSIFTDNMIGIDIDRHVVAIRNCVMSSIDDNMVNLFDNNCNMMAKKHIGIGNAERTLIYNNSLSTNNKNNFPFYTLPTIKITGAIGHKILIQKNTFNGETIGSDFSVSGIDAQGALGGNFEWLCNTFTNYVNCVVINDNSSNDISIPSSSLIPNSGNTYSSSGDNIVYTGSKEINYTYRSSIPTGNINRTQNQGEFNCDLDCNKIGSIIVSIYNYNSNVNSIYPNPAQNKIIANFSNDIGNFNYKIYDALGKAILEGESFNNNEIDISLIPIGIYFIKLNSKNTISSAKFIKN